MLPLAFGMDIKCSTVHNALEEDADAKNGITGML